jgi:L-rhamnose mutarotase
MEKPTKLENLPHPFAVFLANCYYFQKFERFGNIHRSSRLWRNAEWQTEISEDGETLTVSRYPSSAEQWIIREESQKYQVEIDKAKAIQSGVQDANDRLVASVELVNGKRALLEKLNAETEPDMFKQLSEELADMEKQLGAYQPFLDEYKETIEKCIATIEENEALIRKLPKTKKQQRWEFKISEIEGSLRD